MYLDEKGIKEAFAKHLITHRGYSKTEAAMAVSDFPDSYTLPYLDEDYVGEETIDGVSYEKYSSYTCLWRVGIADVPMFRFYTYYNSDDVRDNLVGSYINAHKLYQVDNLDDDDFPSQDSIW